MKKWTFTLIIAAALFTACSKDSNITDDNTTLVAGSSGGANTVRPSSIEATVTNWQSGYSWTVSDSADYKVYSYRMSAADVTSDMIATGAVLVWVKDVQTEEGRVNGRPTLLPFHVLPAFGRPGYDQVWYAVSEPGSITLRFRTNKHKYTSEAPTMPDASAQFRVFMMPASELDKYNYTPSTIVTVPYNDLVGMMGASE